MLVPRFQPLALGRAPKPFSYPDYLFEIKWDGFRSLLRVEQGKCRLISRKGNEFKPGDVLKVPGDPLDDVADDARYGIYTFITTTEKPRELQIAEAIRPLAEAGDLNSAAIRYQLMMDEEEENYRPATLGRRIGRRRR